MGSSGTLPTRNSVVRRGHKVLLSAFACEPDQGSEPGLGWNWVRQTARFNETWVITLSENQAAIEAVLRHHPMPNVHWVYLSLPKSLSFWMRGHAGIHVYYSLWQIAAFLRARKLHREVGFDLTHHITYACYWRPSLLALLPPPFVWGPVGGGESTPEPLRASYGFWGRIHEKCRDAARWLSERDPLVKLTGRQADLALATTAETENRLTQVHCRRVAFMSTAALSCSELRQLSSLPFRKEGPFRLVSIGRLLHWKGFHLALRSFAELRKHVPQAQYWCIGDGPERRNLQRLTNRLGLGASVRFFGHLPRSEALRRLGRCDVLIHPSLHESAGWTCLEAMAAGRPVVCVDCGGPALLVPEEAGFKIPPQNPKQVVDDLSRAIYRLARHPELRLRMGQAGIRNVSEHFSWDSVGESMQQLQLELLSARRLRTDTSPTQLEKYGIRDLN